QLLDPITVLREAAQDEVTLLQQTDAVEHADGKLIPAWLDTPALAERQNSTRDRVDEVRARLDAATQGPPPANAQPEQTKLLERIKVALPHVNAAITAMDLARGKLSDKILKDAVPAERESIVELAKAIEQFGDLKQTIDIASETQKQLIALLTEKKN